MSLPKAFHKTKQFIRISPLNLLFAAAILFSRCGNSDNSGQAQALETPANEERAVQPPPTGRLNIASLFIEADSFVTLDDRGHNKLVFQMYHAKENNSLRAAIYPARNRNTEYDTSRIKILQWRKDSIDIEGMDVFLSDQQTKGQGANNEFKKLINEIEANNSDATKPKITFVIFDPVTDSTDNRRFYYSMYGVTDSDVKNTKINMLTRATTAFNTNPSPPATLE